MLDPNSQFPKKVYCDGWVMKMHTGLINFLESDLGITREAIELAMRHHQPSPDLLPMILWQYGLIDIEQLDRIFGWLENG